MAAGGGLTERFRTSTDPVSAWELSATSATSLAREGAARGHGRNTGLRVTESEALSCPWHTLAVGLVHSCPLSGPPLFPSH